MRLHKWACFAYLVYLPVMVCSFSVRFWNGRKYLQFNFIIMKATMKTINALINLRGLREQSFKFAFGYKGGMKQCYTKGCDIFTPLVYALKDIDLSDAILLDMIHNGELK